MSMRRALLLLCIVAACAGAECRADPAPACSYEQGRATEEDAGPEPIASEIFDLEAGDSHVCVRLGESFFGESIARPRCWGGNALDQLSRRASPEPGEAYWYDSFEEDGSFAVGAAHACITSRGADARSPGTEPPEPQDRAIRCWGNNAGGQLGRAADEEVLGIQGPPMSREIDSFTELALGAFHGCFAADGDVFCWGDNRAGQLGNRETCCEVGERAVPPAGWRGDWTHISAGALHSCALFAPSDEGEGARTACWGDDAFGQLGDGPGSPDAPGMVAVRTPLGEAFVDIAAGAFHTCAVSAEGATYCWGRGASGALGQDDDDDRDVPTEVALSATAVRVFSGGRSLGEDEATLAPSVAHSCILDIEGRAYCWGASGSGQLGRVTGEVQRSPVAVHPELRFDALALGGAFTCGLLRDTAEVRCWGDNGEGQLGRAGEGSPEPTRAAVLTGDSLFPF